MSNSMNTRGHVLVVEDNPDFAALVATLLRGQGYEVSHASDGPQAYRAVQQLHPDLITLDIHMPQQSGALFYRRLRRLEEFKTIPVIVVTGLTRDDRATEMTIKTFLEPEGLTPPADYVEKHLVSTRLADSVAEVLSGSAGRASAGTGCPPGQPAWPV